MNSTMVELGTGAGGTGYATSVMFDWDVWQIRDLNAVAVRFHLSSPARVTIKLAPLNGHAPKLLFDAPRLSGEFSEGWRFVGCEGAVAPPGVYLVSLALDGEAVAETLLIKD